MSVRRSFSRVLSVAVLTAVGLGTTPFLGAASAAMGDPKLSPESGKTAGPRTLVVATYAVALDPAASFITVVADGTTGPIDGDSVVTPDGKSVVFTPTAPLDSDDNPFAATVFATPKNPEDLPPDETRWTFSIDDTAPAFPTALTVSPNPANGPVGVTGSTEANTPVELTIVKDGTSTPSVTRTATSTATGSFSFAAVPVATLGDGTLRATVKATDQYGNFATTAATFVKDTLAPARATTTPADGKTSQTRKTIEVVFAETVDPATSTLVVKNGIGSTLAATLAWSNSNKTATLTTVDDLKPSHGTLSVVAHATDLAGNVSDTTTTFSIDNTAPDQPTVTLTDPVNIANAAKAVVAGKAEPGARVDISVDDAVAGGAVTATANADATTGDYSAELNVGSLPEGKIKATAAAVDYAGNRSVDGVSVESTKDTIAPAAPSADLSDPIAANRIATVSGLAANDVAFVLITVDDSDSGTAAVKKSATPDATGAYTSTLTLNGLKDGAVTATVFAFDAAGNPSALAGTDSAQLDTGLPNVLSLAMPTVNNANKSNVTASGTADPGTLVTISITDNVRIITGQTTTLANGTFSRSFDTVATSLRDGELTVTAVAKDGAGNESDPFVIKVQRDTEVPGAPQVVVPQWVNAAGAGSVELSGTAEPASTLTITLTDKNGKKETHSHVTPPDGNWTKNVPFTTLADGQVTVAVTAKDAAGNESAPDTETTQKDVAAPAAPSVTLTDPINPGNVKTVVVSGNAESGASVTVSVDDADAATPAVPGSGSATAGTYSIEVDATSLTDGAISATAKAKDQAGNESAAGQTAAPSTKDTTKLLNTATSPVDAAVVKPPATVSATFNEPLSTTQTTIALKDKTGSTLSGATSFAGGKTVVLTPVDTLSDAASPYTVTYSAKDADGSDTDIGSFSFTVDTKAPAAPSVQLPAVLNAAGDDAVVVSGIAEPGSSVKVSVDDATAGSPVEATVPADAGSGAYTTTLDLSGLGQGTIEARAVATDVAGNASEAGTATATHDSVAPDLPTLSLPAFVNAANQAAVPVSGTTSPGAKVALSADDEVAGSPVTKEVTADEAGAYATTLALDGLVDGPLTITANATDAAGNSAGPRTTSAHKDTLVPLAPTAELADPVNKANVTEATVQGVAEPGSTVLVSIDDATAGDPVTGSAAADATTGAYSRTVDVTALADGPITASVTARDVAGNTSPATTDSAVKDAAVPAKPAVEFVDAANLADTTVTLVGDAEPGTSLAVSVDDADTTTAPVTATTVVPEPPARWSVTVDVASLADGALTATAVATDAAGNSSEAGTAQGLKDIVPPAVPTVTMPDPVNAAMPQILVSGTAEPGVTVWTSMTDSRPDSAVNGRPEADDEGAYSVLYDVQSRPDGLLTVTAYAEDRAGNRSDTATTTATKDATAPAAPSVDLSDPINAGNTTGVTVSGVAEPGAAVAVSVDDETAGSPVTQATTADGTSGAYSVTLDVTSLADGTLTATVTATDAAGNASPAGTDTSVKDSTLPGIPTIDAPAPVTRASRAAAPFTGTAEPASLVSVTVDDADDATAAVTGTTVATAEGTWSRSLDVSSLKDGVLSVTVTATDAIGNASGQATGSAAKNSTRVFTVGVASKPVSGAAQAVTVTAHTTYSPDSPVDTSYVGVPVLASADGHTTPGTCAVAVEGVATCSGTVFGDLGAQTLSAAEGTGEDALSGSASVVVQATGLVYGTAPVTSTEPNTPFTFTVLPTAGVEGASIDGYAAARTLVTNGASEPANGTVLSCAAAECSITVKFLDRGAKSVAVTDNGTPSRSTPVAGVAIRHHTVLTLSRSALTVNSGSPVTVSGKLVDSTTTDGVPNAQVVIQPTSVTGSRLKPMLVTTGSDGTWSATMRITRNTYFEAKFSATGQHAGSVSPKRLVKAAQVVTSTWSKTGRTVKVTGSISPNAAGRTIYLQYRKADGTWAYAAKATVRSTGGYTLSRTLSAGRWTLRAAIAATSVNAAGYSKSYATRIS